MQVPEVSYYLQGFLRQTNAERARKYIGAQEANGNGGTPGGGTVTSVGLSAPAALFSVSGSPVTGSGTLSFSLINQNANLILAGPNSGGGAVPTFRSLVSDDIPGLSESKLTLSDITTNNATTLRHGFLPKLSGNSSEFLNGNGGFTTPAGGGTVTSVGLTMPTAIFDVAGSPITGSGTLAVTLDNQNANLIFAGPNTGAAAAPTFRALVVDDIPAITESKLSFSDVTIANSTATQHGLLPKLSNAATQFLDGTGVFDTVKDSDLSLTDITTNNATTSAHGFCPKGNGSTTQFLRGDLAWATPAGGSDWDTIIVKSADQTVTNNATPQNDSELLSAVTTNSTYLVELMLMYSANNTTGDYRWRFSYPDLTGGVPVGSCAGFHSGFSATMTAQLTGGIGAATLWPSTDVLLGCDGNNNVVLVCLIRFLLKTGAVNSGNLQFQFANSSAAAGRTSTTRAGSTLRIKKLV